METAPLIERRLSDPIAYITHSIPALRGEKGFVSVSDFLSHVEQLSQSLPDHRYVINLCSNRYLFMVSLGAAILKQQTCLLPPNKNTTTQQSLQQRYLDCYVISDGCDTDQSLPQFNINTQILNKGSSKEQSIPDIDLEQLVVIAFTSGSTGQAKPNLKYWRTLYESSQINAQHMLTGLSSSHTCYQLATVPGQHMWGFETSVLMPMFANVCMTDAMPFFPKDIQSCLAELPVPRMLVTAPVHLRALHLSGLSLPATERVLCATAPLASSLASAIETKLEASLLEVYGCSEVGSMACRFTSNDTAWQLFDGIEFEYDGTAICVSAAHIIQNIVLEDIIELDQSKRRFQLLGRSDDMIEIAGKRGSLQEMNALLMRVEGVIDGVVFFPQQQKQTPRVVAMVVLQKPNAKQGVIELFKAHLDSVFIPRPIIEVAELPRQANGKLSKGGINRLYFDRIKEN